MTYLACHIFIRQQNKYNKRIFTIAAKIKVLINSAYTGLQTLTTSQSLDLYPYFNLSKNCCRKIVGTLFDGKDNFIWSVTPLLLQPILKLTASTRLVALPLFWWYWLWNSGGTCRWTGEYVLWENSGSSVYQELLRTDTWLLATLPLCFWSTRMRGV